MPPSRPSIDTADESQWWGASNPFSGKPAPWSMAASAAVSPKWTHFSHNDLPAPATSEHARHILRPLVALFSSSSSQRPTLTQSISKPGSQAPANVFTPAMSRFVFLCILWYSSSALSSNTGKQIMNQFKYPVTLTFVQFAFVSGYCLVFANPWFGWTRLRTPTWTILRSTFPMAVFQVGGHIFSSMAISRVPVSTVHTIKALSPLFTVTAYALLFGVRYSVRTYASLLPLTFGVMLACSFDISLSNALGLICAFGSAIVFVTSNIFFKKIMPSPGAGPSSAPSHKLDKLNLLFYSSGLAFLLMIPLWMWSDLGRLLDHDHHPSSHHGLPATHGVMYYFFVNGTVHWAQNIIAFAILSSTSPVTYSIASLIKRIAVILIAIAWFKQTLHPIQAFGISLTGVGLWMYNNAKADVERGENKMRRVEARMSLALPITRAEAKAMDFTPLPSPQPEMMAEWIKAEMPSYSMTSAIESQPGHPQFSPTHNRRQSLVPVQLMTATAPLSAPPRSFPGRIDTTLQPPAKHHHRESGQPMSPTESYPSPPASVDSPPQPTFALSPKGASGNLHSRRAYESGSVSGGLNILAGPTAASVMPEIINETASVLEGLGMNVNGVPIVTA